MYLRIIKKAPCISLCNISILQVNSGSMSPQILEKDFIIIMKLKEYKVGDIITFYNKESKLVTHRIIYKNGRDNVLTTKGDFNNTEDDDNIKNENILGKVILHFSLVDIFIVILIIVITINFKKIERDGYEKTKYTKKENTH